jgi:hypothetical protein
MRWNVCIHLIVGVAKPIAKWYGCWLRGVSMAVVVTEDHEDAFGGAGP